MIHKKITKEMHHFIGRMGLLGNIVAVNVNLNRQNMTSDTFDAKWYVG